MSAAYTPRPPAPRVSRALLRAACEAELRIARSRGPVYAVDLPRLAERVRRCFAGRVPPCEPVLREVWLSHISG